MDARLIAAIVISPFVVAFLYAGIHELLRYRSEGKATYGLMYDEDTGTSYVSGIEEGRESYDPEDFDPASYSDPDVAATDDDKV